MRTIDADALYKDICRAYDECGDILEIIDKQPTIQPQKGRWLKDEEASSVHVEPIYVCSACNNMDAWGDAERDTFKFCPNCGARMDGEIREEKEWTS